MIILPVFIALIMLNISWQKWPEILIDFGRELYVPWQISQGSALYKDIAYFNGPLSPHLNAFLFKTCGVGLMTLAIFNIALLLILAYVIYRFYIFVADKTTAAMVASVFLALFAFGGKNYNFVCPYSHEMTHGIFLSILAIYLFLIYLKRRSNVLLATIGALTGMVFLTKIEIFLAVFTALICGFCFFIIIYEIGKKAAFRLFTVFFTGFFLPVLVFWIFLRRYLTPSEALSSVLVTYKAIFGTRVASNTLYLGIAGFDNPGVNIVNMTLTAAGYILVILYIRLTGRALERLDKMKTGLPRLALLITITIFFTLTVIWINMYVPDSEIFRAMPLAMLASGVYFFVRLFRYRADYIKTRVNLALMVMAIFSFILLFKIVLNVRVAHYGFALALPAALLLTELFVCEISRRAYLKPLALWFVVVVMIFYMSLAKQGYDMARFSVGSGKDTIIIQDSPTLDARCIRDALNKIEDIVAKDETFIVLPEGVTLNYLTRRKNPSPYINFMPVELEIFGEGAILGSIIKHKPDYIVLVERDTSVYGVRYFGRDYGKSIFKWVKENYTPVALVGCEPLSNKGFGIVIAKRINAVG